VPSLVAAILAWVVAGPTLRWTMPWATQGAADDVRVKRTPDWPGALEGSWRWLSPLASVPVWPRPTVIG